jgi:hypothetical protein
MKRCILAAEKRGGKTSRFNLVLVIAENICPLVKMLLVLNRDKHSGPDLPHSALVLCRTLDWKKFLAAVDSHWSARLVNIWKAQIERSELLSELSCTVWAAFSEFLVIISNGAHVVHSTPGKLTIHASGMTKDSSIKQHVLKRERCRQIDCSDLKHCHNSMNKPLRR